MFDEKLKKTKFLHIKYYIKKRAFFSSVFSSCQVKIIAYFKFAINKNFSINQCSKTSNSRNLHQHTFAKIIRFIFKKSIFEKMIISSYKISIFFRLFISKISSILSYKLLIIFDRLFRSFVFNIIFAFSHVCRICNDIFEFNNDLHRHLRIIHFDQAFRHEFEKLQERDRNFCKLENS